VGVQQEAAQASGSIDASSLSSPSDEQAEAVDVRPVKGTTRQVVVQQKSQASQTGAGARNTLSAPAPSNVVPRSTPACAPSTALVPSPSPTPVRVSSRTQLGNETSRVQHDATLSISYLNQRTGESGKAELRTVDIKAATEDGRARQAMLSRVAAGLAKAMGWNAEDVTARVTSPATDVPRSTATTLK